MKKQTPIKDYFQVVKREQKIVPKIETMAESEVINISSEEENCSPRGKLKQIKKNKSASATKRLRLKNSDSDIDMSDNFPSRKKVKPISYSKKTGVTEPPVSCTKRKPKLIAAAENDKIDNNQVNAVCCSTQKIDHENEHQTQCTLGIVDYNLEDNAESRISLMNPNENNKKNCVSLKEQGLANSMEIFSMDLEDDETQNFDFSNFVALKNEFLKCEQNSSLKTHGLKNSLDIFSDNEEEDISLRQNSQLSKMKKKNRLSLTRRDTPTLKSRTESTDIIEQPLEKKQKLADSNKKSNQLTIDLTLNEVERNRTLEMPNVNVLCVNKPKIKEQTNKNKTSMNLQLPGCSHWPDQANSFSDNQMYGVYNEIDAYIDYEEYAMVNSVDSGFDFESEYIAIAYNDDYAEKDLTEIKVMEYMNYKMRSTIKIAQLTQAQNSPSQNKKIENNNRKKIENVKNERSSDFDYNRLLNDDMDNVLSGHVEQTENMVIPDRHTRFTVKILYNVMSHRYNKQLFNTYEQNLISDFMSLNDNKKKLLIRLFYRKFTWTKLGKFSIDIEMKLSDNEMEEMVHELASRNFILMDYSKDDTETLINLLGVSELKNICNFLKLPKSVQKNKKVMIETLLVNRKQQATLISSKTSESILLKHIGEQLKTCIKIDEIFRRVLIKAQLLYSINNLRLNLPVDLYTHMVTIDDNNATYPNYKLEDSQLFKDIDSFQRFEAAYYLLKDFEKATENKKNSLGIVLKAYKNLLDVSKNFEQQRDIKGIPEYLRRFLAGTTYVTIIMNGLDVLKREAASNKSERNDSSEGTLIYELFKENKLKYEHICSIIVTLLDLQEYRLHKRGHLYDQLAMVYDKHLKNTEQCARVLITALSSDLVSEIHRITLTKRACAINKKKNKLPEQISSQLTILTQRERKEEIRNIQILAEAQSGTGPGQKRFYVIRDEGQVIYMPVEEVAIDYYKLHQKFSEGIHCEGDRVVNLFGLLFYDVIYENYIPNTFITTMQTRPLDLSYKDFYRNRRCIIDERLYKLENVWTIEEICERIRHSYNSHKHEQSILNLTDYHSSQHFEEIARCMGNRVLSKICERLTKHFGMYRSGFPDILLWSPNENKCKFVEVKGEKDTLSPQQILWLHYLKSIGADTEVCYVHTIGSRERRQNITLQESESF